MSEPNSLYVVRQAVEGLTDKQVRHLVATVVGRLVPGVIDAIVETISAHAESPWDDGRGHGSSAAQDAVQKTCEVCGREGTRQYVQTATGWRCQSAMKCGERHRPHRAPERPATATPSAVAMLRELDEPPTKAESEVAQFVDAIAKSAVVTVSARCKDCNRTWMTTGHFLEQSVQLHEQTHGHIVDVLATTEQEAHSGT